MAEKQKFQVKRTEEADKLHIVRAMNVMLEHEGNVLAAYDEIIGMIGDADVKSKLREFRGDHVRHVDEITEAVDGMGGVAFTPEEPTPMMEAELEMMRAASDDEEAIASYEILERLSTRLYDCMSGMPNLPPDANRVLERAYQDEQKHHAWATTHLGGRA